LSSDWRPATIEELAGPQPAALATGPFGSSISAKFFVDDGVPVIRGSNLSANVGDRLIDDGLVFVTEAKAREFERSVAKRGDLVFTCWGTINQVGLVDARSRYQRYIVSNKQMKLTVDATRADSLFLYYVFSGPEKQAEILDNGIGSSVPGFNLGQLRKHVVLLPPLTEQKRIAEALCALDDRIALLRETNATLEAIAQALFKSWFVDFDPVRAKSQGLAPAGMDEATAALFPDSLDDSIVGPVPNGWQVGTLEDLLVLQRGFDLPAKDRTVGAFPIIAASGPSGTHEEAKVKGPGVVTGRSGVLGRVFLELDDHWPLNTTLWVKDFRVATPCYAYELLRLLELSSFNAGSAVPTLNRNHVHGLPQVLPPRACVEAFETIAMALHRRARMSAEQADTLATLRDTLLPRLISGQLRLPEAEKTFEEAPA
jgi:type I restriction enzyme S subunit